MTVQASGATETVGLYSTATGEAVKVYDGKGMDRRPSGNRGLSVYPGQLRKSRCDTGRIPAEAIY